MKITFFAASVSLVAMLGAAASPALAQCTKSSGARAHTIGMSQSNTIVDVAVGAGQFQTLVAAVQAAGLAPTLMGDGPFTVFAPTDAAFSRLPGGTVENLLRPENRSQLARILSYHVVSGRVTSDQLAGRQIRPATVAGPTVAVDGRDGVTVNNARVVQADVRASNGVIHVIDRVLMPPARH
jgi:uncharacterized surface protein with fasciclin (FAS1) repeats